MTGMYKTCTKGAKAISDITKGLVKCVLAVGIVIALPKPSAPHINNSEQPAVPIAVTQQVVRESEAQVKKATEAKKKAQPKKQKPKPKPKVVERPPETVVKPSGTKQEWMAQAGIPSSDWPAVDFIIHKESTWRPTATNNIGCVGLGQSCPGGSGLVAECPNWQSDPVCQLRHFSKYAKQRYGGWWSAHAAWTQQNWW